MTLTPEVIEHIGAEKTQDENGSSKKRQNKGLKAAREAKIACSRNAAAKLVKIEPGVINRGKFKVPKCLKGDKKQGSQLLID